MDINPSAIEALLFDYGNTLVPFGREQFRRMNHDVAGAIEERFGSLDLDAFLALRQRDLRRPYEGDPPVYCENDFHGMTEDWIRELYGHAGEPGVLRELLRVRRNAFVKAAQVADHVPEVLGRLRKRFRLGLLSNYPDGKSIRLSLEAEGVADCFDSVVVSGDLGYVKPHPLVFAASLKELGCRAGEVLFVGDNWLADVQGAKRVGMPVVLTRQWDPVDRGAAQPGDHSPDAVIEDLRELEDLLMPQERG